MPKTYYAIYQYCPNLYRKEVCNVGVVMYQSGYNILKCRFSENNTRIKKIFCSIDEDIHYNKKEIESLLEKFVESRELFSYSYDWRLDIDKLIRTKNIIRTDWEECKIIENDVNYTLNLLFKELVFNV